jgi:hypothetical protein
MNRFRRLALGLYLCATPLAACTSSSPVTVSRRPDASLLLPCVDPMLAVDDASDNEIAAERIRVAQAYLACRQRQADLAAFVRGG